jgi:two-component system, chemotaxis family, sensor histidine kinase and response regulator PixL
MEIPRERSAPYQSGVVAKYSAIVFIVEDDEDLLSSMAAVLEDADYLVLGARNGREALARMNGVTTKSVAIVDLHMPDMNGVELIHTMRADPQLSKIPVIVATAAARAPANTPGLVLFKPLTADELLRAVSITLRAADA